jgi:hypothetical protein
MTMTHFFVASTKFFIDMDWLLVKTCGMVGVSSREERTFIAATSFEDIINGMDVDALLTPNV